jgi:hypothetical protein
VSTDFYDYVAPEDWQTLNALEGFGRNALPPTGKLAGQAFDIEFGERLVISLAVTDAEHLTWQGEEHRYRAREVLDDVFFVEFQLAGAPDRAVALVLDLERRIVLAVLSTVVDHARVDEEVLHGRLAGAAPGARHERTHALVGHRVQYIYSADHAYEHVYLNDSTFTWHCLAGAERGQADTEPTLAYEIRDRVYLFTWRERVVPCDGVVVIDWANLRLNGRIFGWDTTDAAYNSISMGARAVPLNVTAYAPLTD